jgi:hypothetical protein
VDIIKCPGCGNSLPPSFTKCHICGADLAGVARPKAPVKQKYVDPNKPAWVYPAYNAIAGYFLVSGLVTLVFSLVPAKGGLPIVSIVASAITIIFGIGLLAKIEFIRGIANVLCFLNILGAVLRIAGSFVVTLVLGPLGILMLLLAVIDLCTNVFMIYLIGETD